MWDEVEAGLGAEDRSGGQQPADPGKARKNSHVEPSEDTDPSGTVILDF